MLPSNSEVSSSSILCDSSVVHIPEVGERWQKKGLGLGWESVLVPILS